MNYKLLVTQYFHIFSGFYHLFYLFENLNNTQRNYTLAYGSYSLKRPRYKDLIIRGFTVYPTQVGVKQNFDVYY